MATEKSGSATKKQSGSATKKQSASSSKEGSGGSSKKTSSSKKSSQSSRATRKDSSAPRTEAPRRMPGPQVAKAAERQLLELTGKQSEGITGLQRTDDGWTVRLEVVELRRIPDTTDVLASYEVEMSSDGELIGYRRLRRYVRGVPGEE
jgi:hypothetical protein